MEASGTRENTHNCKMGNGPPLRAWFLMRPMEVPTMESRGSDRERSEPVRSPHSPQPR